MQPEKIIAEIKERIKENKDYAPLAGALIGYFLTSDRSTKSKITSALVGGGLGYILKDVLEERE